MLTDAEAQPCTSQHRDKLAFELGLIEELLAEDVLEQLFRKAVQGRQVHRGLHKQVRCCQLEQVQFLPARRQRLARFPEEWLLLWAGCHSLNESVDGHAWVLQQGAWIFNNSVRHIFGELWGGVAVTLAAVKEQRQLPQLPVFFHGLADKGFQEVPKEGTMVADTWDITKQKYVEQKKSTRVGQRPSSSSALALAITFPFHFCFCAVLFSNIFSHI